MNKGTFAPNELTICGHLKYHSLAHKQIFNPRGETDAFSSMMN
jgi:hypothetical protein